MKIFEKTNFPASKDLNLYEWKEAETHFEIPENGKYLIAISASAKNEEQNNSSDDDDLRFSLDGFDFGKYEIHEEQVSWKGFGTSASFDGASLKGGTKTVYVFTEIQKGDHILQFFADKTPNLKKIEISKIENNSFELEKLKPEENIKSDKKGIPWMSFVFLGSYSKNFTIAVNTKSSKEKKTTDGDNLKIVINGKILQNEKAPTSDKYKNFYFSGDLEAFKMLSLNSEELKKNGQVGFENSIELWCDENPEIYLLKIEFFDVDEFFDAFDKVLSKDDFYFWAYGSIGYFKARLYQYSALFLENSLKKPPENLFFENESDLAEKIRKDSAYQKILEKIKQKIAEGILDGEIFPNEFEKGHLSFESSKDLIYSIHGIHKIEYKATSKGNNEFEVDFTIFDIYDFGQENIPDFLEDPIRNLLSPIKHVNNILDYAEEMDLIGNFEIEIKIQEILKIEK